MAPRVCRCCQVVRCNPANRALAGTARCPPTRRWHQAQLTSRQARQYPKHAEAIAAYDTQWHQMIPHAIDGTVEIFSELVKRDAPVYAITNWNGKSNA